MFEEFRGFRLNALCKFNGREAEALHLLHTRTALQLRARAELLRLQSGARLLVTVVTVDCSVTLPVPSRCPRHLDSLLLGWLYVYF